MRKIYISGPISGKPIEETKKRFAAAAKKVREYGYTPISPMDMAGWGLTWRVYMQIAFDILASGEIDEIWMLPDWEESNGATMERYMARLNGLKVAYLGEATVGYGKEAGNDKD